MPLSIEEIAVRKSDQSLWTMNDVIRANIGLREKQNWQRIMMNDTHYCQSALQLGMLLVRREDDLDGAMTTFARSLPQIDEMITLMEAGHVPKEVLDIEIPLYVCVLSGDMTRARKLSHLVLPKTEQIDSYILGTCTWLLGAVINNDKEMAGRLYSAYNKVEKNVGGKDYITPYMSLCHAIMQNNQEEYTKLMHEIASSWTARAKDKNLEKSHSYYGGGIESNFVLDFMALSVAAIAHRHGMTTTLDTAYFPQSLYQRIIAAQG
jgi:hypothetical protein